MDIHPSVSSRLVSPVRCSPQPKQLPTTEAGVILTHISNPPYRCLDDDEECTMPSTGTLMNSQSGDLLADNCSHLAIDQESDRKAIIILHEHIPSHAPSCSPSSSSLTMTSLESFNPDELLSIHMLSNYLMVDESDDTLQSRPSSRTPWSEKPLGSIGSSFSSATLADPILASASSSDYCGVMTSASSSQMADVPDGERTMYPNDSDDDVSNDTVINNSFTYFLQHPECEEDIEDEEETSEAERLAVESLHRIALTFRKPGKDQMTTQSLVLKTPEQHDSAPHHKTRHAPYPRTGLNTVPTKWAEHALEMVNSRVTCRYCMKRISATSFSRHIDLHTRIDPKPWKCTICPNRPGHSRKDHLKRHVQKLHKMNSTDLANYLRMCTISPTIVHDTPAIGSRTSSRTRGVSMDTTSEDEE